MQRYTIFFITVNSVHVSGGFSAHHQELENCTHIIGYMSGLLAAAASVATSKLDNVYKKRLKSLYGAFQNVDRLGLLYSYPNKFPHSSPEAPRIIQMREISTSEGGN
jgi:hypothetical protein